MSTVRARCRRVAPGTARSSGEPPGQDRQHAGSRTGGGPLAPSEQAARWRRQNGQTWADATLDHPAAVTTCTVTSVTRLSITAGTE